MELEQRPGGQIPPASTIRPRLSLTLRQSNRQMHVDSSSVDLQTQPQAVNSQGRGHDLNQQQADQYQPGNEHPINKFDLYNNQCQVLVGNNGTKNLSRSDLLRLLSIFEAELQSKEITIAVLKSEQLKRLVNPIHINSEMATRYRQLQQCLELKRQSRQSEIENRVGGQEKVFDPAEKLQVENVEIQDDEEFLLLNEMLELLERNPLLALSQDAIYMLDFDCDEMSTRNYLHLKIQHLEHIINQNRRYRLYINERLHLAERRCLELSWELETERQMHRQKAQAQYTSNERDALISQIEHYQRLMQDENEKKQSIILTLLNDLLDEREKRVELSKALSEQKTMVADMMANRNFMVEGLKEESERSLMMEAELDTLGQQLQKQSQQFDTERTDLTEKMNKLELQNFELRAQIQSIQDQLKTEKSNNQAPTALHGCQNQGQLDKVQNQTVQNRAQGQSQTIGKTAASSPTTAASVCRVGSSVIRTVQNSSSPSASGPSAVRNLSGSKVPSPTRSSSIHRSSSASSSAATSQIGICRSASGGTASPQRNSPSTPTALSSSSSQQRGSQLPSPSVNSTRTSTIRQSQSLSAGSTTSSLINSITTNSTSSINSTITTTNAQRTKPQVPAKPAFVTAKRASLTNSSNSSLSGLISTAVTTGIVSRQSSSPSNGSGISTSATANATASKSTTLTGGPQTTTDA